MAYWLLVIVVVCAVAFWLWQYREKTQPASRDADDGDYRKYHSVAVICSTHPCESVKRLEGKRFLSTEAPILRLEGCTADSCQCRYIHYDDRRDEERRHPYGKYGSTNLAPIYQERRIKPGRRNTDVVDHDYDRMPDMFV
jgi:hypothetical protein